jgi:hypothetical protein
VGLFGLSGKFSFSLAGLDSVLGRGICSDQKFPGFEGPAISGGFIMKCDLSR